MLNLLILEPAFSCLTLLPKAKELGYFVIVVSAEIGDRRVPEEYHPFIDQLIIADSNDTDSILYAVKELKIDAVIPGSEYHTAIAAEVAEHLRLPGNPVEGSQALRNKHNMRRLLSGYVRIPKFFFLTAEEFLSDAASVVGFPAVIKPTSLAGSLHVKKVENFSELHAAYQEIQTLNYSEMGNEGKAGILVEEYIGGEKYSVEGVIQEGEIAIVSITKKIMGDEPYFVEMGHIVGAEFSDELSAMITDYVKETLHALKLHLGVFHFELKVDDKGPVVIEIAGRLPGDHICELIEKSKGIALSELMIQSHVTIPVCVAPVTRQLAGIIYFTETISDKLESLLAIPGCVVAVSSCEKESVMHPETFMARTGYAIFTARSLEEMDECFAQANCLVDTCVARCRCK